MLKSNVTIEKFEELKEEAGCGCGGSCACGDDSEIKTEKVEIVANDESCGCGNGGCC